MARSPPPSSPLELERPDVLGPPRPRAALRRPHQPHVAAVVVQLGLLKKCADINAKRSELFGVLRGHPFITFAKFSGFWSPTPLFAFWAES